MIKLKAPHQQGRLFCSIGVWDCCEHPRMEQGTSKSGGSLSQVSAADAVLGLAWGKAVGSYLYFKTFINA